MKFALPTFASYAYTFYLRDTRNSELQTPKITDY